jgi:hypothetical protein
MKSNGQKSVAFSNKKYIKVANIFKKGIEIFLFFVYNKSK